MVCKICNRILNRSSDPLSPDCGGDCFGCILDVERDEQKEFSMSSLRDRIIELENILQNKYNHLV